MHERLINCCQFRMFALRWLSCLKPCISHRRVIFLSVRLLSCVSAYEFIFKNVFVLSTAMANPEPHGFAFDHVGRRPAGMMSFRQRRSKSSAAADTRSSFRLSSLRGALFNGNPQATKNRQQDGRNGANVDKTQSSGVLRSLFSRQVDKSPSSGDLWVDVDLHRPASPSLDNVSVTSSDWTMAETAPAAASRRPELDRSASMEEGNVAMVRRSNSARPATRRPLPMRASSVPHEQEYHAGSGVTAEPVWVQDSDLWTQEAGSQNHARLSADSGHVSCKLISSKLSQNGYLLTVLKVLAVMRGDI